MASSICQTQDCDFFFSSLMLLQSSPLVCLAAMKFRHKPLRYLFRCFLAYMAQKRLMHHH